MPPRDSMRKENAGHGSGVRVGWAGTVLMGHLQQEAEDLCAHLYRSGDRGSWFLPSQRWSCSFVGGKGQP